MRLPTFITRLLLRWAHRIMERDPDETIAIEGDLLLHRWYVVSRSKAKRWPRFNVYIHRLSRPDRDRGTHDHPWAFATCVLQGWYQELIGDCLGTPVRWRYLVAGEVGYCPLQRPHRIVSVMSPTVTLIVTGPNRVPWGFWPKPGVWVHWRRYHGSPERR